MIIGITGKIASGKTTLAQEIQKNPEVLKEYLPQKNIGNEYLFEIIEVDEIGHELLKNEEIQKELVEIFGEEIMRISPLVGGRKKIDRKNLRKNVFSSPAELEKLEKLLHPKMQKILRKQMKNAEKEKRNTIIVCALPDTFLLNIFCTQIIHLEIDKKTAWQRAYKRNINLKKNELEVIWERQKKEYK